MTLLGACACAQVCDTATSCPPGATCCCMREFFGYCFTWACCPLQVRDACSGSPWSMVAKPAGTHHQQVFVADECVGVAATCDITDVGRPDRPLLSSDFFAATLIFLCHCLCFGAQLHSHR